MLLYVYADGVAIELHKDAEKVASLPPGRERDLFVHSQTVTELIQLHGAGNVGELKDLNYVLYDDDMVDIGSATIGGGVRDEERR